MAQEKKSISTSRRTILQAVLVILGLVIGFSYYSIYQPSIARTIGMATTYQPETYTELAFSSSKLPAYVKTNTLNTFTFRVINHETKTVSYHYTVTQSGVGITQGNLVLAAGAAASQPVSFKITRPRTIDDLVVHLDNTNQEIYFRSQS
jgi:hypothetical protein